MAAAVLLLSGCSGGQDKPAAGHAPGPAGGPPPAMPVSIRTVQAQPSPVLIDAVGEAEGSKDVEVHARVTGVLEKQSFSEGQRVVAGSPMFTIERAPFEIALQQARASLASEQARTEQARRELQRLKPLADIEAIPRREADDAASAVRLAEAALAVAQAQVRNAELNLSYTTVNAPITGISGRADKSVGSLVSPTDGVLTRITQTDPLWVRFSFSESEYELLRRGKSNTVRLLAADGTPLALTGKLNFAGSAVDPRLGTVQMRAAFANPELSLLPGQFVRAQVQAGELQAHQVPQAAVWSTEQGKMVWTVQGGKAVPTPVEVGGWVGGDWIVRKGLKDGDQVIVDNLLKLRPGAAVVAAGAPPAAAASAPASAASR